ncbi:MAG: SDR family oxidoreductase [Oscillospiraceae bacterium]|nr:SDR family oxidoreductase [Oscillospiraceae bacterium]
MSEKMSKILIIGGTGMLGHAAARHLSARHEVWATYRGDFMPPYGKPIAFNVLDSLDSLPNGFDYVINCVGVIKPYMEKDPLGAIEINAAFPWRLANWCRTIGAKLLHISTDCVYSGKKGGYTESELHDPLDAYGKSKSLGECSDRAMVLRTSIIGEELRGNLSLLEWTRSKAGQTIDGYVNHMWNGVTTNALSEIFERVISDNLYEVGLFHLHAADDICKRDMVKLISEHYDLGLTVRDAHPEPIDRTLRSEKSLCAKLKIPTVEEMIKAI